MPNQHKGINVHLLLIIKIIMLLFVLSNSQVYVGEDGGCTRINADDDDDSDDDDDDGTGTGTGTPCCLAGTYLDLLTSTCKACAPGCATCTDIGKCKTCITGLTAQRLTSLSIYVRCLCSNQSLFYSPISSTCQTCSLAFTNCFTCTVTASGAKCQTCQAGFYYSLLNAQCIACASNCATCSSSNPCLTCLSTAKFFAGVCTPKPCSALISGCLACTTSPLACTSCDTGFHLSGTLCASDGPCPTNCLSCGSSGCETCFVGYVLSAAKTCEPCQAALSNLGCIECTSTQCSACLQSSGYTLNTTTFLCESSFGCQSNEFYINEACTACLSIFGSGCVQCNANDCIGCQAGYLYDTSSKICQANLVCGDGIWIDTLEPCDDANSINFDGCNSNCQVEPDYACLVDDKLPSGASFCKFTKDFTIELNYIEKQVQSNIAHLFFVIHPSTFMQWTSQELQKLMAPITIVDQITQISTVIPFSSIKFQFRELNGQNQLQLIIDYGGNSIQESNLKFSINPTATTLASIKSLSLKSTNFAKLSSSNNAVDLFSYSHETYQFQKTVSVMSAFLGYTAMIFAFLGLLSPVGKLIIVEALVVIQLSFFSILQFKKIPPTFIGFRNLTYSNGYNDPHIFQSGIAQNDQTVFKLMGLNQSVFTNYNFSFIIFFGLPFLMGFVGLMFNFFSNCSKKAERQLTDDLIEGKDNSVSKVQSDKNESSESSLKIQILKRITFEVCFYSVILTGYLAWISIFYGLKNENLFNILFSVIIVVVWLFYGFKFFMEKTGNINLKQKAKELKLTDQNSFILKGFGEFKDIHRQISKSDQEEDSKLRILYFIFMSERIFVSSIISYSPSLIYASSGIIAIYAVFLVILAIIHRSFNKDKDETKKVGLLSHISGNYVLRQAFNFVSVIAIQFVIMGAQIALNNSDGSGKAFVTNDGIIKLIPILILSFILINLLVNIFLWIWELKASQIIQKAKQVNKASFSRSGQKEKLEKQSNMDKETVRKIHQEEQEVEAAMGKYFDNMILNTPKNSPFLGVSQKAIKGKLQVSKLQITIEEDLINGQEVINELRLEEDYDEI